MTPPALKPLLRRRGSVSPSTPSDNSSNQRNSPATPSRFQQPNLRRFSQRSSTDRSAHSTQSPRDLLPNITSELDQFRFVTPESSTKSSPPTIPTNVFLRDNQKGLKELPQQSHEKNKMENFSPTSDTTKSSIDASRAQAVVVGAGLTGLTVAHFLKEEGIEPVIFEKSSRVGGRVLAIHCGKSTKISEKIDPSTSPDKLPTIDQEQSDHKTILQDSSLERQTHKIDVGFQSIPHDCKDLLDLIKSLGLQVCSVGDGTLFVQPPGKRSAKSWKCSMVKDQMLRPSGGMSALVDSLHKDIDIRTNHELIHISWSSNYWRLLFQLAGSKSGFSIATRLLFIAIPPKQFAKVGNDNVCIPRSLISVMERFPTQYTNTVSFVAHYNSQFWGSSSPVAFSPRGPVVEAYTMSLSETGPYAIVGKIHSRVVKTIVQDPKNSPNSRPDLKVLIIRHLCDLFGMEAQSARSVTIVDWREMDREDVVKNHTPEDSPGPADRLRNEMSMLPDYPNLYEQFCESSQTLALRGLYFVLPDCQAGNAHATGDVALQAKRAVSSAARLKNFL